jgi:hypothetical protein
MPASDDELRAAVRAAIEESVAPLQRRLDEMTKTLEDLQRCTVSLALRAAPTARVEAPSAPPPVRVEAPSAPPPRIVVAPPVEVPAIVHGVDPADVAVDDAQLAQLRRRPKPALYLAMLVVGLFGTLVGAAALSHL